MEKLETYEMQLRALESDEDDGEFCRNVVEDDIERTVGHIDSGEDFVSEGWPKLLSYFEGLNDRDRKSSRPRTPEEIEKLRKGIIDSFQLHLELTPNKEIIKEIVVMAEKYLPINHDIGYFLINFYSFLRDAKLYSNECEKINPVEMRLNYFLSGLKYYSDYLEVNPNKMDYHNFLPEYVPENKKYIVDKYRDLIDKFRKEWIEKCS